MNINELKVGAKGVTLEATVVEKEEPREVVTKYGKRLNVANLILKDETGSISLSLWGDDIDLVGVGDKIKIINGYVGEFRGTPQLSVGKYGKMEVIEKSSGKEEELSNTEKEEREEFPDEDQ
ncbi:MAG: OB-fold nucleic acid binding domain-containing protein [Candidatus Micrarchaeaceae archaeon]